MSERALIVDASELKAVVDRGSRGGVVALDTEFVWERTYYPNLGVVQIALDEDEVFLVDPQALDIAPLGRLLEDPSIELVLHDAVQDLQILARATGAFPVNVFDTQRVGGFVGFGATRSLQDLLAAVLEIEVEKGETRSNWLQRPLTESQRTYAANDVRFLPHLREQLLERAENKGNGRWLAADRRELDDPDLYREEPPEAAVHRVRGRGRSRLNGRQRAVLGSLAAWREREARDANRPRRHVLPDKVLVDLAKKSTRIERPTEDVRLKGRRKARYAEALERAIAEGREGDPVPVPRRGRPTREDERKAALVRLLRAVLSGVCARSGIDEKLVATKAELEQFVNGRDAVDSPVLKSWRAEFVGEDLRRLLAGDLRVTVGEGWPGFDV